MKGQLKHTFIVGSNRLWSPTAGLKVNKEDDPKVDLAPVDMAEVQRVKEVCVSYSEAVDHLIQSEQCLKFKVISRGVESDRSLPRRHSSIDLLWGRSKEQEISGR